jgi:hypothetical protein
MRKWEYLILDRWRARTETGKLGTSDLSGRQAWFWIEDDGTLKVPVERVLNAYGKQGWELVSIAPLALDRGQFQTGVTSNLMITLRREVEA